MTDLYHPIPAEWLSAYYDGELDAARRQQVEAHLPTCADCQRELAAMESLSQALSADEPAAGAITGSAAFWHNLRPQLVDRLPARQTAEGTGGLNILVRWLPGVGLLLVNGAVQVGAVAGAVLVLISAQLPAAPAWAARMEHLAASSTLGWLSWVVPADLGGLGLFALWIIISAGLAVLYLAWLGYELRYGPLAVSGRVTA